MLQTLAGDLLLDPVTALKRLAEDTALAKAVEGALAGLTKDDPLAAHYRRVLSHARGRAQSGIAAR